MPKGWAFYKIGATRPLHSVNSWRVFQTKALAYDHLSKTWCAMNGVELRRVGIVERGSK